MAQPLVWLCHLTLASEALRSSTRPVEVISAVATSFPTEDLVVILDQAEDDAAWRELVDAVSALSVTLTSLSTDWSDEALANSCESTFLLLDQPLEKNFLSRFDRVCIGIGEPRLFLIQGATHAKMALDRKPLGESVSEQGEDWTAVWRVRWPEADWPSETFANKTNFMGHTLRVAYDIWRPFFFENSLGSFDGILYRVAMMIATRLNLTIQFVPNANPGIWALRNENGSWKGMINMVSTGEVDMSASGFFLTSDRGEEVDFSFSLIDSDDNLFIKRIHSNRLSLFNYFCEFTRWNWLLILVTGLTMTLAFVVVLKFLRISGPSTVASSIVLRGLLYKGTSFEERRMSVRILTLVHLLFVTVIVLSYRSCMNGFLAISQPVLDVRNLNDVEKSGKKIAIWGGGAVEEKFSRADVNSLEGRLYQEFVDDEKAHANSYEEVMQIILDDGNYVGIVPPKLLTWYPCGIVQVPGFLFRKSQVSFIFTKGSKFLRPFNKEIVKLKEDGVIDRLMLQYLYRSSREECDFSRTSTTSLTFDHVFTPFAILGLGVLSSLFSAIVENIFKAVVNGRNRIWDVCAQS